MSGKSVEYKVNWHYPPKLFPKLKFKDSLRESLGLRDSIYNRRGRGKSGIKERQNHLFNFKSFVHSIRSRYLRK